GSAPRATPRRRPRFIATRPRRVCARHSCAGDWRCCRDVASRATSWPANPGCVALRTLATPRLPCWSVICAPTAASGRPIMPRPRSGCSERPSKGTRPPRVCWASSMPPARWAFPIRRPQRSGCSPAQAELGNLVLSGGAVSELLKVGDWFEGGAHMGDPVAAFNLAVCLTEGLGVERDDRKAAEWIRRAAESLPVAQYWYGRILTEGR